VVATIDRIYAPVRWLKQTPLKQPINWYLNLWLGVPAKPTLLAICRL
jgi:hypothetical protein